MARKRIEMMEKARAKRSRREEARQKKKPAASGPESGEGLPEKVIDLTQEALDLVEGVVKSTSKKLKEVVSSPAPTPRLSRGS